jgi:hypothetical protein
MQPLQSGFDSISQDLLQSLQSDINPTQLQRRPATDIFGPGTEITRAGCANGKQMGMGFTENFPHNRWSKPLITAYDTVPMVRPIFKQKKSTRLQFTTEGLMPKIDINTVLAGRADGAGRGKDAIHQRVTGTVKDYAGLTCVRCQAFFKSVLQFSEIRMQTGGEKLGGNRPAVPGDQETDFLLQYAAADQQQFRAYIMANH